MSLLPECVFPQQEQEQQQQHHQHLDQVEEETPEMVGFATIENPSAQAEGHQPVSDPHPALTPAPPGPDPARTRKRRAHTKSRRGCANCKLRGIKCDETKPKCQRCTSFGVACVYGPKTSRDALVTAGSTCFRVSIDPPTWISESLGRKLEAPRSPAAPLPYSGSFESGGNVYALLASDVALLERFHARTIHTIGPAAHRPLYRAHAIPIGFMHPFVMHLVLTLTLIHDTALEPIAPRQPSRALQYHWSRALTLFHQKLAQSSSDPTRLTNNDRDALWVGAAFLGIASFAGVEPIAAAPPLSSTKTAPSVATIFDSFPAHPSAGPKALGGLWPLRPASPTDLSWLKLNSGKKQVWDLVHPMRMEGLFRDAARDIYEKFTTISGSRGISVAGAWQNSVLPATFPQAFDLTTIPPESNSYYAAVVALEETYAVDLDRDSDDQVLPLVHKFVAVMEPRFRDLLEQKDGRALLLLAYWYAKVCHRRLWWLWRRAWMEGLAICCLLERRWDDGRHALLRELLGRPKTMIETSA